MKLLGSTESKITKDKNGENVPHLEIVELVLVHCNLVKGYGFISFARNFSDKYSKSLMDKGIDVSKKSAKTAGKKILKEIAKATGDLIGNKIADKITSASKKSHDEVNNEIPKERYIYPKKRQKIIDELKLT